MGLKSLFIHRKANEQHRSIPQSARSLVDQWYKLTREQIDAQHTRLLEHDSMRHAVQEKLDADPQLKARIMSSLSLADDGTFDCNELMHIRDEVIAETYANDIVLNNEYSAIVGKLELAYQLDLRQLESNPDTLLSGLTPYYELDFIKSYLKI